MNNPLNVIPPGFGARLREERSRLGLSQTELGQKAGIQRLAQSQYETETRFPTIRYLADIGGAGVNLYYLLFGKKDKVGASLSNSEMRNVEQETFKLVEEYVQSRCNGEMSAEGRFVLFELLRSQLIRASLSGQNPALDTASLIDIRSKS